MDYVSTLGISGLGQWPWLAYGDGISSSLALLLAAAALAWSPGQRRATQILSPTSWPVLIAPGAAMGLTQPYLWTEPLWLVTLIVIAALAVAAAAIILTIPGPAARGLVLLLAAPAYPAAVWAIGYSRYYTNHVSGFPFKILFLPTVLIACLATAALRRSRSRNAAQDRASGPVSQANRQGSLGARAEHWGVGASPLPESADLHMRTASHKRPLVPMSAS